MQQLQKNNVMKNLIFLLLFTISVFTLNSQVPEAIKYQTVVRDATGQIIPDQNVSFQITVLQGGTSGTPVYQEEHYIQTNEFGLVNLAVGLGSTNFGSFNSIDWGIDSFYIRIELDESGGSAFQPMGVSEILSVPYALYSKKAAYTDSTIWKRSGNEIFYNQGNVGIGDISPAGKLIVRSDSSSAIDDVIFSVLNYNGDTVMAVYQEGVRIWVPDDTSGTKASGSRGGFAVGGYSPSKASGNEYLRVTPDSVRVYIKENSGTKASGNRGGFAVGGFSPSKSFTDYYFNLEYDSAEVINPSEPRMLWYPNKEAFMAGRVLVEDVDSVGVNSTALGYESKAIGEWSQAFGFSCHARGNY